MASYQYEQLNYETFQQLSQSLLVKEFPGLQCFPVGQPDGGRDAIVRFYEDSPDSDGFIIFQVKFARRDLNPSEAREWLLGTLRNELPKVRNLIKDGAKRFVLVTNVAGTAHHEAGSMDKLHDLLVEHIPIPAQAWWRDDLDRRLDDAWDLKFVYPTLFSGTDFLRLIVEATPSEDRERRQNAIRAFLSQQFDSDREVKFKQADLENDIFDLFTDVPLSPGNPVRRERESDEQLEAAFLRAATSASGEVDSARVLRWLEFGWRGEGRFDNYRFQDDTWLGAASLLLDSDFQQVEPLVILEGAPGQGKSTIVQYICQVHRVRVLARQGQGTVHPAHLAALLRLPFKVELRDFATWLAGGNPFGTIAEGDSENSFPKSLEGFLSALVHYGSGGTAFKVSDLQAILSSSPVLIVLDGLDEVAEIKQRQRVIEEITSAVNRLNSLAKSIQVVVTSRPTPFINLTVLPSGTFATYSLGALTRPLISEYADRWLKSRSINEADANDVRKILSTKLNEPHLRDLARNPMQLAILLSLIHRRGISLPDKRTALYDNYVEIFFDRESEKAPVVKENRDLLIRIHRYLAWILQAGAEVDSRPVTGVRRSGTLLSGSIAEGELKELLKEFLERDGSDSALVEKLFSGVVERVVAIVSRVQGTYEFDVQTLREYFAARHLYETAPYSPAGDEHRGTRSDRWRALSRNFYWLNVARFYAGCYSEGELASLVDDLRDLSNDEVFRSTSHPQVLTAALLGDWVFSQRPRAIEGAVELLLEPRGLRMFLAGARPRLRQMDEVIVRDSAGKRRLIAACKELVESDRPFEQVLDIVENVLRPNADPEELFDWWMDELRSSDYAQASKWCLIGELLQCWSIVDLDTVRDLLSREEVPAVRVIAGLLDANRMDILEGDEGLFNLVVDAVLAGEWVGRTRERSPLQMFASSVNLTFLGSHRRRYRVGSQSSLLEYRREVISDNEDIAWPSYDTANHCARLVQAYLGAAERPVEEWFTSIDPWDQVVQQGIKEFGERPRFIELANFAAGIRSREEKCQDSPDLLDSHRPMVRRARYARLRAGSRKWWLRQLQSATNADEVRMALLFFATWAGGKTIEELANYFDDLVASLEPSNWRSLHKSLVSAVEANAGRPWIKPPTIRVNTLPSSLDIRTVALLAERSTPTTVKDLYERYLTDYEGDDPIIVALRTNVEVRLALADETKWSQVLETLSSTYRSNIPTARDLFSNMRRRSSLPDHVARKVADQPLDFPSPLVQASEVRCRQLNARSILPVGTVAADEGWFTD